MSSSRTPAALVLALALTLAPAVPAADVERRLPPACEWVLHVNLRTLAEAPAVKKHGLGHVRVLLRDTLPALKPLADLGIDPTRDVASVTAAGAGPPPAGEALLIVRGRFDTDKAHATADGLV